MVTRCAFENSHEIGVFSALTNAYALIGENDTRMTGCCSWLGLLIRSRSNTILAICMSCALLPTT